MKTIGQLISEAKEHVEYLESLIPDLKHDKHFSTARDFEKCVEIIAEMSKILDEKLAEKIADELFKLNGSGTVKNATMLTPSFMNGNDKVEAGYYVKSEVVDLIKKVVKR